MFRKLLILYITYEIYFIIQFSLNNLDFFFEISKILALSLLVYKAHGKAVLLLEDSLRKTLFRVPTVVQWVQNPTAVTVEVWI